MISRRFAIPALIMGLSLSPAHAVQQTSNTEQLAAARALLKDGKVDEAIISLEALARMQPETHGVARELGLAYYRKNRHADAVPHLEQAVQENPDDKEAIQLLGLSYHFIGRPQKAIPLLEKVGSWFPVANVDASYVLGVSYIQIKDYEKARRAFAGMFAVPPDSGAAYYFMARMLLRQGYDPVAEQHALKAATLEPGLPRVHALLGELYTFKSRIPEAIAEFEKELAINPADAATYHQLADAYVHVMKFEEAQRLLQRSIWLNPNASGPYVLMGKVLLKKGETELAARTLQRALALDPNNAMAHHLLGEAYRKLGRTEDAERELKRAAELQALENPRP